MELTISYGEVSEKINDPDLERVSICLSPQTVEAPEDMDGLVRRALGAPIGSLPLRDMARGKERVCILISDHTRPTPSGAIIQCLLEELAAGGVKEDGVTVIVSGGLHERATPAIVEKMLGQDILKRVKVVVHDPDNEGELVSCGTTSLGTPLWINRLVVEADISVSVSTIEPHLFYGWSGGAKNLLPGVSARRTVNFHHSRFSKFPRGLDYVEGNKNREDAEEAARLAGVDFICNVVLNPQRRVIGVFAGDTVKAHRAGVEFGRGLVAVGIPEKADILMSALGGSPRDADFWQAQGKALMHTQHLVKDGGIIILAAGCENGVGGEVWRRLLLKSPAEINRLYQSSDFSVPLMKANDLVNYTKRAELWLVCPGIGPADLPQIPVRFFPTVSGALAEAKQKFSGQPAVVVVPDGSRVVVNVAQQ